MKRSFLILAFLALLPLAALAQDKNPVLEKHLQENIFRTGVNTNPYEYLPVAETPVPAGYKPFYISHYGRHGSRSDWEGTTYSDALKVYGRAHELGLLTEEGEAAYKTVAEITALHNHMDGRLTARGCREHRQISGRMFAKYKKVFKQTPRVRALSSTSPRCIVSMAAFTGELLARDPKLFLSWDTGDAFMTYCSSVDPDDVKYEAYKLIFEHAEAHYPDTAQFYARIFKDPSRCREAGDPHALLDGTFAIAAICGSFDYDDTMLRLFTADDRYWYAQNVSMNLYLRQCNSKEFGERRMAVAEVQGLVDDIVAKADEVIAGGGWAADLRFGHDYQLLAGCSRMGIKGIAERLDSKECLDWPGYLYSPFAGNLQIVFYRGKKGDVLVKFYINERETTLITLPGGPYYKWEDVKEAFKTCP